MAIDPNYGTVNWVHSNSNYGTESYRNVNNERAVFF